MLKDESRKALEMGYLSLMELCEWNMEVRLLYWWPRKHAKQGSGNGHPFPQRLRFWGKWRDTFI